MGPSTGPLWRLGVGVVVVIVVASGCNGIATTSAYASVDASMIWFTSPLHEDPYRPVLMMRVGDRLDEYIVEHEQSELTRVEVEKVVRLLEPVAGCYVEVEGTVEDVEKRSSRRSAAGARVEERQNAQVFSGVDKARDVTVTLVLLRADEVVGKGRRGTHGAGALWHLSVEFGASQGYLALQVIASEEEDGAKRLRIEEGSVGDVADMAMDHMDDMGHVADVEDVGERSIGRRTLSRRSRRSAQGAIITVMAAGQDEEGASVVQTVAFALTQSDTELTVLLAPEFFENPPLTFGGDVLTICGSSRTGTVLSGDRDRVFSLNSRVALTLTDMTVTSGSAIGGDGGCIRFLGDGAGSLTMENVHMTDCYSTASGGCIVLQQNVDMYATNCKFTLCDGLVGGVIWTNGGVVNVTDSIIHDHSAEHGVFLRGEVRADKPPSSITNCVVSDMTSRRLIDDTGVIHSTGGGHFIISNTIFEEGQYPYIIIHDGDMTVQDVEIRFGINLSKGTFHARYGVSIVERVYIGAVYDFSRPGLVGHNVTVHDYVVREAQGEIRIFSDNEDGSLTGTGLVRNNECRHPVLLVDSPHSVVLDVEVLPENTCTTVFCFAEFLLVNWGATAVGSMTWNGTEYTSFFADVPIQPPPCADGTPVLCGSGVFSNVDGVCRHETLEASLSDCNGDYRGTHFVDGCGECVAPCPQGQFYSGECDVRACISACPEGVVFDGFTCGGTCVGPETCPDGETLVDCFESSIDSVRECVVCEEGNNMNLVACGCTGRDCSGCAGPTSCPDGRHFLDCEDSSVPGRRQCVPCPPDSRQETCGGLCRGPEVCPLGEGLVHCAFGEEGERVCEECAEGFFGGYYSDRCYTCTSMRDDCFQPGFAFIGCPAGGMWDVSECRDCGPLLMYANVEKTGCFDTCPSGEYTLGSSQCAACDECPDGQYAASYCTSTFPTECTSCWCSACSTCPSGTVEVEACGPRSDTVCEMECVGPTWCPIGEVLLDCGEGPVPGLRECVPCPARSREPNCTALCWGPTWCPAGTVFHECWNSTTPLMRECIPCPQYTYEADGACHPCRLPYEGACTNALFIAQGVCEPGSTEDDTVCTRCEHETPPTLASFDHTECVSACGVGEFEVNGYGQCQACDACEPGQFYNSPCTDADRHAECLWCTVCGDGESVLQACTNVSDTICGECVGPTSCPPGEILLDCAQSSVYGERECAPCPEGRYESGGVCVRCGLVAEECLELGYAFTACGVGESSDVTACTDCGSLGLLATVDRDGCSQVCTPGGYIAPGSAQCEPCLACPVGSYQSLPCTLHDARECSECSECPEDMVVVQACSQFADTVCGLEGAACSGPSSCAQGMLWLDCGQGSVEGIRECVTCPVGSTADTCVGVCAGPVACLPGEVLLDCGASSVAGLRECVPCPQDQYNDGGVCVDCAHTAGSCADSGYAFGGCGTGESGDVSTCTECGSMGKLVSVDGTTCVDTCGIGEFVDSGNVQCQACAPCSDGEYASTTCTASVPAVCLPCSACGEGMVASEACSAFADTVCVDGVDECPFGYYVHPTAFVCVQCDECADGEYMTRSCSATSTGVCLPCTECGAGTVVREACSTLADTDCVVGVDECPFGYYVDPSTFQCAACADCLIGTFLSTSCSTTVAGVCSPCSDCEPGLVVSNECSALADVVCVPGVDECPVGEYVDPDTFYCAQCDTCPDNHFMAISCTATHSGVCQKCSVCGEDELRVRRCSGVEDTICAPIGTGCPFGLFLHAGTGQCEACPECTDGQFASSSCSALLAGVCRNCSVCDDGLVEVQACSEMEDTVCAVGDDGCPIGAFLDASSGECQDCLPCPGGYFMETSCTATRFGLCRECSVCAEGQVEVEPCSALHDTVCEVGCPFGEFMHAGTGQCEACPPCADGEYMFSSCTALLAGVCLECGTCGEGLVQVQACSDVQDTVCGQDPSACPLGTFWHEGFDDCAPCAGCPGAHYLSTPCTATVAGVCSPCTVCGEGLIETQACSIVEDRVCGTGGDNCAFGEFFDEGTGQCERCVGCASDHYMSASCSAFVAGVCNECTVCGVGMVESVACSDVADTVCEAVVDDCLFGTFFHAGTGQCEPCAGCSDARYMITSCSATIPSVCSPCSVCADGFVETASCTAVTDTVCVEGCLLGQYLDPATLQCEACSGCSDGTYMSSSCTASAAAVCSSCSVCGEAMVETTACTAIADTVCVPDADYCPLGEYVNPATLQCEPCAGCASGYFMSASCTATAAGVCSECSECGDGFVETGSCTAVTDTVCEAGVESCPFGEYVHPGTLQCAACAECGDGTYMSASCTASGAGVCSACSVCGGGFVETASCAALSDTVCEAGVESCPFGQYVDPETLQCAPCAGCASGYFMSASCSATAAGVCSECSECGDGFVETGSCTADRDTVCEVGVESCPFGEYVHPGTLQCAACAGCGDGTYMSASCTASGAGVCSQCSVCGDGMVESTSCTAIADTVCVPGVEYCPVGEYVKPGTLQCVPCAGCDPGYFMSASCTATAAGVCSECSECGDGFVETGSCTAVTDTVCEAGVESCPFGEYVHPGTLQCAACAECGDGTYMSSSCTASGAGVCSACSVCGGGFVETASCTALLDTVCEAGVESCPFGQYVDPGTLQCAGCAGCASGYFMSASCTATAAGVCSECSECGDGFVETGSCTADQDTVCEVGVESCPFGEYVHPGTLQCASCAGCGDGTYMSASCTASGAGVCSPCSECGAGLVEAEACTAVDDTVCVSGMVYCPFGEYVDPVTFQCVACISCPQGTFMSAPCSAHVPSACSVCSACGEGMLQAASCTVDTDTVCVPGVESCPFGEYVHPGTLQCAACAECGDGTYMSSSCTASGAGVCSACSVCGGGFVETASCTALSDTVCEAGVESCPFGQYVDPGTLQCAGCAGCASGYFMSASCTATAAGVCSECSECGDGFVETGSCTADQDTVCEVGVESCPFGEYVHPGTLQCAACAGCGDGTYMSASCTASGAGVCSACSVCGVGFVETASCAALSDTVCEAGVESCPFGQYVDPETLQCAGCAGCASWIFHECVM